MRVETERLFICLQIQEMAGALAEYYQKNQRHLMAWEPKRGSEIYSEAYWANQLKDAKKEYEKGSAIRFIAFNKEGSEIVCKFDFTGIQRGFFQACYLGFSVAEKYQGKGYAQESLQAGIDFIFNQIGLHRIMANYMPSNKRSGQLLDRLGFQKEGVAKSYLKIAGKWEDHVLTSLVNKKH